MSGTRWALGLSSSTQQGRHAAAMRAVATSTVATCYTFTFATVVLG